MNQEENHPKTLWVTPLDLLRRKLARNKKELQEQEQKQTDTTEKEITFNRKQS
jgi:hypothetical protein